MSMTIIKAIEQAMWRKNKYQASQKFRSPVLSNLRLQLPSQAIVAAIVRSEKEVGKQFCILPLRFCGYWKVNSLCRFTFKDYRFRKCDSGADLLILLHVLALF
jgi:hypothetical protein